MIAALIGLPLLGATVLLLGGRRTDAWGHFLAVAMSAASFLLGAFLFIQMEYCHSNLKELIDQGELWKDRARIMKLLRQILEALAYIHDSNHRLIHRDLKVANSVFIYVSFIFQ